MEGMGSNTVKYATLSMNKSDRLRFMEFPEDVYRKVETVLRQSWPPGVKSEAYYAGSYEYTLRDKPWGTFGQVRSVGSRRLLRDVLQYLYDRGWVLTTAINLSEKVGTKDTLLFKKTSTPPPPSRLTVVQFYWRRKIFLHGANESLIDGFRALLTKLDYFEKEQWNHDAYEFQLKGTPWYCEGEKVMKVRRLILGVMELMDNNGWESYSTIRQRAESDDAKVCDSWYFIRRLSSNDSRSPDEDVAKLFD